MLADRLLERDDLDDEGRVRDAYERTLGREPTDPEMERDLNFVEMYFRAAKSSDLEKDKARRRAWQSLCRAILSSNEFIYLE